jgi:IS30 family transposase
MKKPWKILNKSKYKNIHECLNELKKKVIISHWILDIVKNKKNKIYITNKKIKLYRIKVKNLGMHNIISP